MGLHPIDWALVAAYLVAVFGAGLYFGSQQRSSHEYFLGNGSLSSLALGISAFATFNSTIFFLSFPGEVIGHGPMLILTQLTAIPIVLWLMLKWFVPVLRRHQAVSLYGLLEQRSGLTIRLTASTLYILACLIWMSMLTFMGSKAIVTMLGWHQSAIYAVLALVVLVSLAYSSTGDFRAVVATDVAQAVLLGGGLLLTIATVSWQMGGLSWLPTAWDPNWEVQPFFSFDPTVRSTFVSYLAFFVCFELFHSVSNQSQVQRLMAASSVEEAKKTYRTLQVTSAISLLLIGLTGLALLGYAHFLGPALPLDLKNQADLVFPWFIAHQIPAGLAGLVLAGLLAAAMSSVDSGVNAITALVSSDFLGRFGYLPESPSQRLRMGRGLSLTVGAVVLVGAASMTLVESGFLDLWGKVNTLLLASLFGLVLFGLFRPQVGSRVMLSGAVAAAVAYPTLTWSDVWFGLEAPICWQWALPGAFLANLVVTLLVARHRPPARPPRVVVAERPKSLVNR